MLDKLTEEQLKIFVDACESQYFEDTLDLSLLTPTYDNLPEEALSNKILNNMESLGYSLLRFPLLVNILL